MHSALPRFRKGETRIRERTEMENFKDQSTIRRRRDRILNGEQRSTRNFEMP